MRRVWRTRQPFGELMHMEHDKPLTALNTLGFTARAEHYVEVYDDDDVEAAVDEARQRAWPVFVLGGGSNLVLTADVPGLVIRPMARHCIDEPRQLRITAGAGLAWDSLVRRSIALGRPGLENLTLIPGSVGAAPVQNIGAYGVELAERFLRCRAYHLPERRWHDLQRADCDFAYRDSLFKRCPGEFLISEVSFEVGNHLPVNTKYQSLDEALQARGETSPDAATVSRVVADIRRSKLPDPDVIPNVGSFFKNPVVDAATASALQRRHPALVSYPMADGHVKLAAGWLIDSLGYKGVTRQGVGVHERQALVLVHHGGADGQTLMSLAGEIREAVRERFGVTLEPEPVVI